MSQVLFTGSKLSLLVQVVFLVIFLNFFFTKIEYGLYVLDRFDVLMSKIILKKIKKYHWHIFWHEKLFEKHPQPHCQTRPVD